MLRHRALQETEKKGWEGGTILLLMCVFSRDRQQRLCPVAALQQRSGNTVENIISLRS